MCIRDRIQLDKLEFDIGTISLTEIENGTWVNILKNKISETLSKIHSGNTLGQAATGVAKPISIFRQWLFYMENGYLPWNAKVFDKSMNDEVLSALSGDFNCAVELRKAISRNATIAERIIFNHQENFAISLSEALTAEVQLKLPEIIAELLQLVIISNVPVSYTHLTLPTNREV